MVERDIQETVESERVKDMMANVEPQVRGEITGGPTSILFVEDNEDHFIIAWHQLRKLNVAQRAHRVASVDEMIAYLHGAGEYYDRQKFPLPSVIVLDMRLPGRDGFEAQAWVRAKLKFRNIPIILISTPDMEPAMQSAVRLGANAYMTKPFKGPEFQQLIDKHKLPVTFAQA
jgi:two-component system response regulator